MGPLQGVKVLDLTSMVSGPMGAMILADQGAEVIKVEPLNGELVRHMAADHCHIRRSHRRIEDLR